MENEKHEQPSPPSDPAGATAVTERRRTGLIVHDERGNARVEWVNVPSEGERVPLSLEDTQSIHKPERGYNPYHKTPKSLRKDLSDRRPKRDLRRLSEWIKQMRALEASRQQQGDSASPNDDEA